MTVERLQDRVVGAAVASTLWLVLATVGVVLLISCANVANLFLVRADARRKELAVRTAIGAGSGRVASVLLAESLVLGAAGGAVGVMLASVGIEFLLAYGPAYLPRLHEVKVDAATLAFTAGVSIVVGLVLGLIPLLRRPSGALAGMLRDGGRASSAGRERHRTRNILVAGQLAMALVLLIGSSLMLRSSRALGTVDPGFDPDDVLTVGLSLGEATEGQAAARFYRQVADEVAALPGVVSVGLSNSLPVDGSGVNGGSFYIESKPRQEGELPPTAMYKAIGADYLEALRQPLLTGRTLELRDWQGGEPVALVNETFAKAFLDGDAIGERIKWGEDRDFIRIVGVVGDVRELDLTKEEVDPWAYLPMDLPGWHHPEVGRMYLLARTSDRVTIPPTAIREIVRRIDPAVPLTTARTMDEVVAREMAGTSFMMALLGVAAGAALFLGAIGLFGVISYVVAQRTREIGVRVALGARGQDIQGLVFRQSAIVGAAGVVVGLLGAMAATRFMGTLLYGVSTTDPVSFAVAPAILTAVVATATWIPARRASKVSPIEALRAE